MLDLTAETMAGVVAVERPTAIRGLVQGAEVLERFVLFGEQTDHTHPQILLMYREAFMLFIKIENGSAVNNPVTEENFRQVFPKFSSGTISVEDALSVGYGLFFYEVKKSPFFYEVVEEGQIVEKDHGRYWQTWIYREMTDEEKAKKDADVEANVRIDRDYRLKRTVDLLNPIVWDLMTEEKKQEWKDFRQALLNVSDQEGFPQYVDWPVLPSIL